jgi:hypothetical protein
VITCRALHRDPALSGQLPLSHRAEVVKIQSPDGVRPCGWTKSSWHFDRLPGVLILELGWAEIT